MMCLSPLRIANPKCDKSLKRFWYNDRFDADEYSLYYGKEAYIDVPCGSCEACIERKSNEWATRIYYEYLYSTNTVFLTLTYADEFLTYNPVKFQLGNYEEEYIIPVLCKRDVQLFMKRLRKKVGNGLRFFCGAEYGEETGRPHYHLMLFNLPDVLVENILEIVQSCWSYGNVDYSGNSNIKRVMYIAKYCYSNSKLSNKLVTNFVKPFILCSRMPALGHKYYEDITNVNYHNETLETVVTIDDGRIMPMPRLYRNKLFTETNKEILYNKFINDEKKFPSPDELAIFLKRFNQKKRGKSI